MQSTTEAEFYNNRINSDVLNIQIIGLLLEILKR